MKNNNESDKYASYMNREDLAKALGVTYGKIRLICQPKGANQYFGAEKVKNIQMYPPSSLPLFKKILLMTPGSFKNFLEDLENNGDISLAESPSDALVTTTSDSDTIDIVALQQPDNAVMLQRNNAALLEWFKSAIDEALSIRVAAPEDRLLTGEEARAKLGGRIPKTLRPIRKNPSLWSNNQINEQIVRWRQGKV